MPVALQKPKVVHMNGRLRPWDEAVLHVGCEAVIRGVNVFEGLKAYWREDDTFAIVMMRRHYDRLRRSARLLHIPFEMSFERFEAVLVELASTLAQPNRNMWFRTTLFAVEGHWGEDTVGDLVVTGYQTDQGPPHSVRLGVSTWRRSPDVSLPARIKTGANYQVARLARIEGRRRGCDDMVLLNQEGRVAEGTGSCILMVRDGTVYTPPATEGALESITLDVIEALARSMDIPFVRRPIDRTELLVADEIALCGTLAEVAVVESIDGNDLPNARLLTTLQQRFFAAVCGSAPHPIVEWTVVPVSQSVETHAAASAV
jgi:branched-chain amino acid aminotransferase